MLKCKFLAYGIACIGWLSILLVQPTLAWSTASAANSGNSIAAADDFGLTISYCEVPVMLSVANTGDVDGNVIDPEGADDPDAT